MALINRVTRLFKADFHAVLDRIEEPEQLLRQAIREMEDELQESERRVQLLGHEQEGMAARKSELESRTADLDEELDLCFAREKNDLARTLVRRKLEAERLSRRLGAKLDGNDKAISAARSSIRENRTTLDGLKQKAEIFARRAPAEADIDVDDSAWMARELTVSDDEIEVAFLREQQARSAS